MGGRKFFLALALFALIASPMIGQPNSLAERVTVIDKFISSLPEANNRLDDNLRILDSLFNFAVKICNGCHSEALLALTFSSLTFKEMPLHTPIFGIRIDVPLPFVRKRGFEGRIKRVPKVFYSDSPNSKYSDRDKPAHFFGNAFLSNNLNFFNFTKLIGIFIEVFEDNFKVDGTFSRRDIRTNLLGEAFGKMLKTNPDLKPSDVFYIYNYLIVKSPELFR